MEQCDIGDANVCINLDHDRLMMTVKKGINPYRCFYWEPGNDPKWVSLLPRPETPEDTVSHSKILWVIANCLGENPRTLSQRMIEGMLCRADVREFFQMYLKWRTKAEETIAGWPWNMCIDYVEELEVEAAGYRAAESLTPLEINSLEFISRRVPSRDHPYYDDDLRENGSQEERERATGVWRKGQLQRVRNAIHKTGRGSPS